LNQRPTPPLDGLWVSLGRFRFEQDGQAYVLISNEDADGHVIVDAVQWLPSPQTADAGQTAEEGQTANSNPPADPATGDLPNLQRQIQALEQQQRALRQQLEQQPKSMAVTSKPDAADLPILVRGDHKRPGEIAPRGFLSAIRVADPPPIPPHGDARLALAQWVAANDHPLTARVYANRVWSWLMGRPLVPTSNNFGTTGEPPTHPALLDWLASELIRSGWSTKHLVRLIVTSQAYQLAVAGGGTDPSMVDPDNRYFGRGQRRRLSVEALRDAMLFASGELEFAPGGSQIKAGTIVDYHYAHDSLHRSIYQPIFRNALPDLYAEFDFADPSRSVGRRDRSTTARQALALANSPWVLARARATARRLRGPAATEAPPLAARELVINAYRTCLQRDPQPVELERCLAFLQPSIADNEPAVEAAEHDPLVDLVQALFGSIDFRFVD
jgi:hypothetical protein